MNYEKFRAELKRELIRAGLWGPPAIRFQREIFDHFATGKETLLRQGLNPEDAETSALTRLGTPSELAQMAATQIALGKGSQLTMRFTPLVAIPFAWLVLLFVFSVTMVFLGERIETMDMNVLAAFALVIQFAAPWVTAFVWILWGSLNPVRGWNHLLVTSAYLAASSTSMWSAGAFYFGWDVSMNWFSLFAALNAIPFLAIPWVVRGLKLLSM